MPRILIADDEASIRTILTKSCEKKGYQVLTCDNGDEAYVLLKNQPMDVALLDIRMPGMSGLDLVGLSAEYASKPALFIMTAQDTMHNAVTAMKRGAYDYVTKPFDLEEVHLLLNRALEARQLAEENSALKQKVEKDEAVVRLVGKSRPMQEVFKVIGRVAHQDVSVLIEGESGTGKELVAKAIHAESPRALFPFVAVNCSAIPDNLLESELFGYKKGAFTGAVLDKTGYFEQAHKGTLFLDEIGDMPLALQAKLLRVLQERQVQRLGDSQVRHVDFRLITATNKNLKKRVSQGLFREDLFFRLNVVGMSLPPLRERKSDIPLLVDYFLERCAQEFGGVLKTVPPKTWQVLKQKSWAGNVRELENTIKRAYVLSQGDVLTVDEGIGDVPVSGTFEEWQHILETLIEKIMGATDWESQKQLYQYLLPLFEKPLITFVLKKTKHNQLKAASILGLNRNTLRKKITELKIKK